MTHVAAIDHIIIAATDLDTGRDWLQQRLGVVMQPGGQHLTMGTHNALLGLGQNCYLEIIAVDPTQPPPDRPRWFGLDRPNIRQRLQKGPFLLHWVARVEEQLLDGKGIEERFGRVTAMSRGNWHWRLTIPDDGSLPLDGAGPSLISWSDRHPASSLPESGCRLTRLVLATPDPEAVRSALGNCRWPAGLAIEKSDRVTLRADLQTPTGPVSLS